MPVFVLSTEIWVLSRKQVDQNLVGTGQPIVTIFTLFVHRLLFIAKVVVLTAHFIIF